MHSTFTKSTFFNLSLLLSIVLLSGCTNNTQQVKQANMQSEMVLAKGEVLLAKENLKINKEIMIDAQSVNGNNKFKIVDMYFSALGKQCILVENNIKTQKVLCETHKNIFLTYPYLKK